MSTNPGQSQKKPTIAPAEFRSKTHTCQTFIDTVLKPRFLPNVHVTPFNYPVDIQGKWHGSKYRFLQRYRSGFDDKRGEEFDAPFVRIDWIRHDHFDVQWHRHTGPWFRVHHNLSLNTALTAIITNEVLHPH